jgi:hypothetical protein
VQLSCLFGQTANFDAPARARYLQRLGTTAALLLAVLMLAGCQTVASSTGTPLYEPIRQSKMVAHAKAVKAARAKRAKAIKEAREARAKAARSARARAAQARAAQTRAAQARAAQGGAAQAAPPAVPAESNRPALGVEMLGEELRLTLFQERLRGLCEIVKVYQLSSHLWRTTCAKGGAFNIKVYPDGYMSLTRS